MKAFFNPFLFVISFWLLSGLAEAGDKFVWDPITPEDWKVAADSAKGIRNAVMLFEKITRDDESGMYERMYEMTIYRRNKIFNQEGREWGDFTVPYIHKKQKVVALRGRTVLPDGREFPLLESQIFDKDVIKAKGVKIKQKSGSLPGIADGCIVEYYIKLRTPTPSSTWYIQKNIALRRGEMLWKFSRPKTVPAGMLKLYEQYVTPNYMWFPSNFIVGITEFCKKNKRLREIIAGFSHLDTKQAQIEAAYNWVQTHIKNVSFDESDEEYKDNEKLDDVLKNGYGTQLDINGVFLAMLRAMDIKANMAYVVDRDENLFLKYAKYWQFDRSLVAVAMDSTRGYRFLSPGDAHLPAAYVPWYNEGVEAYVVGETMPEFLVVPYSKSQQSRMTQNFQLKLKDDLNLEGAMGEQRLGHFARSMRLVLSKATASERQDKLREEFKDILPEGQFDSLAVKSLEETNQPLMLNCKLKLTNPEQPIGSRLFLKPFSFLSRSENPFQAAKRQHSIMFRHACELIEVLHLELPESWQVEALAADTAFTNKVGSCEVKFTQLGSALSVQRHFKLQTPFWSNKDYELVRKLFQARQAFNELTLVLKNTGNGITKTK